MKPHRIHIVHTVNHNIWLLLMLFFYVIREGPRQPSLQQRNNSPGLHAVRPMSDDTAMHW